MANGFQQNTNQPSGQFSGGGDFSGSLNDILAPYQQMAQQFQSPYATMKPNSWLAQNHPQIAGVLDNAFLGGAMTPGPQGPEGVGGGISRAMQGMVGTQQFRRQQMMQNAMLPFQMMQPQLQAQDMLSQIQERHGSALRAEAYNEVMVNRFGPGGLESQKIDVAQQRADQAKYGRQLSDPMERMAHDLHPFKDPQNPTQQEYQSVQQEYMRMKQQTERQPAGSYEEQIFNMQNSPDPAVKAMGDKAYTQHIQTLRAASGARVEGEQSTSHPYADTKSFLVDERKAAYNQLPPTMNAKDYEQSRMTDSTYWKDQLSNPGKPYQDYIKAQQTLKQQTDVDFSKYEKSGAPKKGVSYSEYLQNRTLWDGSAPSPAPATSSSSATGSNWTPKTN